MRMLEELYLLANVRRDNNTRAYIADIIANTSNGSNLAAVIAKVRAELLDTGQDESDTSAEQNEEQTRPEALLTTFNYFLKININTAHEKLLAALIYAGLATARERNIQPSSNVNNLYDFAAIDNIDFAAIGEKVASRRQQNNTGGFNNASEFYTEITNQINNSTTAFWQTMLANFITLTSDFFTVRTNVSNQDHSFTSTSRLQRHGQKIYVLERSFAAD